MENTVTAITNVQIVVLDTNVAALNMYAPMEMADASGRSWRGVNIMEKAENGIIFRLKTLPAAGTIVAITQRVLAACGLEGHGPASLVLMDKPVVIKS